MWGAVVAMTTALAALTLAAADTTLPPAALVVNLVTAVGPVNRGLLFLVPTRVGSSSPAYPLAIDTADDRVVMFDSTEFCAVGINHDPAVPCVASAASSVQGEFAASYDENFVVCSAEPNSRYCKQSSACCSVVGDLSLSWTASRRNAPFNLTISGTRVPFLLAKPPYISETLPVSSLFYASGIFGIGFAVPGDIDRRLLKDSSWNIFDSLTDLTSASEPYYQSIGLDLYTDPAVPSKMYVGGVMDEFRSTIQWSEAVQDQILLSGGRSLVFKRHALRIYGLSACDTIFTSTTTVTHAYVDSLSSCLTLPPTVFDALMSWLPVACEPGPSGSVSLACYFTVTPSSGGTAAVLPTLSFRLGATSSYEQLHLPLDHLLLPAVTTTSTTTGATTTRRRLCINRADESRTSSSDIIFGSYAMSAFYIHLDKSGERTGIANKAWRSTASAPSSLAPSTAQCKLRQLCKGMQTTRTGFNQCVDPDCAGYYFLELDEASKTCALRLNFHYTAIVILGAILALDMTLAFFNAHVSGKVLEVEEVRPSSSSAASASAAAAAANNNNNNNNVQGLAPPASG